MRVMFDGAAPHPRDADQLFAALEAEGASTVAEMEINDQTQATVRRGRFAVSRAMQQQRLELPGTVVSNDDGTSYVYASTIPSLPQLQATSGALPMVDTGHAMHLNCASILTPIPEDQYGAVAQGTAPYWPTDAPVYTHSTWYDALPVSAFEVRADVCWYPGCGRPVSTHAVDVLRSTSALSRRPVRRLRVHALEGRHLRLPTLEVRLPHRRVVESDDEEHGSDDGEGRRRRRRVVESDDEEHGSDDEGESEDEEEERPAASRRSVQRFRWRRAPSRVSLHRVARRSVMCEQHEIECAHEHPREVRVPSSRPTRAPLTTQLSCAQPMSHVTHTGRPKDVHKAACTSLTSHPHTHTCI